MNANSTAAIENQFAAELAKNSYPAYCYLVHRGKWIDSKFHMFLANRIQDFIENKTDNPYDILVLSTPPQHGKSMTVTETLPSWFVGNNPDKRCIVACYNDDFARKFGRRNKSKIDDFGQYIFDIKLSKSSDRDIEISGHYGGIIARGIMSGITGNAGDLIIIDDPIKNRLEADSPTYRGRLWEEWLNSIKTRTQAGTKIIIIQTRWHEDDLAGRVIRLEKNVTVINLPVEAEENDLLGRKPGEALCPEIGKDDRWLTAFKAGYTDGSRAWNALFQGRPTSEEGNIIKREWWKYYDTLPETIQLKAISVDASFKGGEDHDFVAIETWGKVNADFYLIDIIKQQMDFPDTVRAIKAAIQKCPDYNRVLIEDKANGSAIISTLRHEIHSIVPINPDGGKIARANACAGMIEAGNVYLPRYAAFTSDFVEDMAAFPNGTHDDTVDACTQLLNYFKSYRAAEKKIDAKSNFEKDLERYKRKMLGMSRR